MHQGSNTGRQWREDAACLGADPELFFPISYASASLPQVRRAKRICQQCPVIFDCMAEVMCAPSQDGIWAATTPDERRRVIAYTRVLMEMDA